MKKLSLEIRTPEKSLFSGKVKSITLNAVDGQLGILPDHAPIATVLAPGSLRYELESGETVALDGKGGFLILKKNIATILLQSFS